MLNLNRYLSKEEVNLGRQPEIDCLKAFCIVPMIMLHTYEELAEDPGIVIRILQIMEAFSGAAAFMLCMGLGSRYSRNESVKGYLIRGFEILTVGQLLNILRDSIPSLIAWAFTKREIFLACSLLVIQADILTFAGLAFIFLAILKHLNVRSETVLIIGVFMNAGCFLLSGVFRTTGHFLLDQVIGFFVVTDAESYFPLCSYFIFVAFGYWLGGMYKHIKSKDKLFSLMLCVLTPIVVAYYALRMNFSIPILPEFFSTDRYVMNPLTDSWLNLASAVCLVALFYKIIHWRNDQLPKLIKHFSKYINSYYCLSFMFITPLGSYLVATRDEVFSGDITFFYSIFVIIACYFLIECNEKHLHFGIAGLKGKKKIIVYSVIWIMTFFIVAYVYPRLTEYATVWNDYLLE